MRGSALGIAAVRYSKGFDIDAFLVETCRALAESGVRLGGFLQISEGGVGGCATRVHLYDLQTRSAYDIWEDRGTCARGCRLDEAGLDAAATVLDRAISDGVDMLVINRFGRAESLGRGLLPYFAQAIEHGIPVLTGVRSPYDKAWSVFHGGMGHELPCDAALVLDWATGLAQFSVDPDLNHTA
ncbi:MAG: DUF2478 domain-containing protein [Pseudomonadota bacterium]